MPATNGKPVLHTGAGVTPLSTSQGNLLASDGIGESQLLSMSSEDWYFGIYGEYSRFLDIRFEGEFMPRIKGVTESDTNDDVREIFEEQKKRHGFVSNTAKILALRPTVQRGVQALAQGIQESGLITQELRNLVCVRAAHINGCPY